MPKFMENKKWFVWDKRTWKYKLTKLGKQNKEVVKSYDEYCKNERIIYVWL